MNPKITLVVPVYNTSQYLDRCLTSIAEQSFEEFEVICVDDVSSDGSLEMVKQVVAKDSRFRLVQHEVNCGQGGARNTGIALSKASYIATADSDDYLERGMLERLYDASRAETADMVCCGYNHVKENGELIQSITFEESTISNSNNTVNIFTLLNPALWNKLFKRTLFSEKNIKFPNYLNYEDLASTPRLVAKSDLINIIEEPLYNYVERENSVVTSYSPKHVHDYFEAFEILQSFLDANSLWGRYQEEFHEMINYQLRYYLYSMIQSGLDDDTRRKHMRSVLYMKLSFLANRDDVVSLDVDQLWDAVTSQSKALPAA